MRAFQGRWSWRPTRAPGEIPPAEWLSAFSIVQRCCILGDGAEVYLKRDAEGRVLLEGGALRRWGSLLYRSGKTGTELAFEHCTTASSVRDAGGAC